MQMPIRIRRLRLKMSDSLPKMTEPMAKNTMKAVITQLTPDGLSPNAWEIAGVETLKTVSFRTAKKTR